MGNGQICLLLIANCLSLSLLKTRILFVDHIQFPLATNNFAICTSFLNGCSNFHLLLFVKQDFNIPCSLFDILYLYLNMILPLVKSYGLISTPTLSPGNMRM